MLGQKWLSNSVHPDQTAPAQLARVVSAIKIDYKPTEWLKIPYEALKNFEIIILPTNHKI